MRHAVIVLVGWMCGTSLAIAAPLAERTWTVDGVERQALVHVPSPATSEPAPVAFAFHGHGGNMHHAARTFSFEKHWPAAIVVYMQGLKTTGRLSDPEGKKNGWQHYAGEQNDRDLKFFDAVLASLKQDYKVDENRIYATGHSNGGAFTYLLWAMRGEVFAAVAPSGSVATKYVADLQPKPALHVAGKGDALVRYRWQQRGMERVRELNGCDEKGEPWDKAGGLVGTVYPSKTHTPFVSLISPCGHQFPNEAPALIVKFFKEHAKK